MTVRIPLDREVHPPALVAELTAALSYEPRGVEWLSPSRAAETGESPFIEVETDNQAAVEQVVANHVIPMPPDTVGEFRAAVEDAVANEPAGSALRKLADALLGTSGPGAEPRRPDRAPA